ncbi:MAG: histidinol-phosphatase [Chitinophagales bacterium]
MLLTNYHSHTHYCDGKLAPEAYIKAAIKQGLKAYGFSSHAPLPFPCKWAIPRIKIKDYLAEIEQLSTQYRDEIEIYTGLEVDYIPGRITPQNTFIRHLNLDYTIGSIHFVGNWSDGKPFQADGTHAQFLKGFREIFDNDAQKFMSDYFKLTRDMITLACPDIVGHLDKLKIHNENGKLFSEQSDWYVFEVLKTLEVIKKAGAIMEVNTRGIYKKKTTELYPSTWILEYAQHMDIPICLSSDCHHPNEITKGFEDATRILKAIGFKEKMVLIEGGWKAVGLMSE